MAAPGTDRLNRFQIVALVTVLATLFLIFVGGLVRASGAGLGCPDWPKCFGVWIPPTHVADLPPGWDPALFNPVHTWTEYVNRLIGVVIGLLITATLALSFRHARKDPAIPIASFGAFVLVLFQAWLGGQVVKSGLAGGMITLHMMLAMVIVNLLLFATWRGWRHRLHIPLAPLVRRRWILLMAALLGLTLLQMVLGTQVRETVDAVKNGPLDVDRSMWLNAESAIYIIHRSFSWLVLLLTGAYWWFRRGVPAPVWLKRTGTWIILMVLSQIVFGVGMERFGMPGALQVLHLITASILVCLEFAFLLAVWDQSRSPMEASS